MDMMTGGQPQQAQPGGGVQQALAFYQQAMQALIQQGMNQQQAHDYALQLVAQQFGREVAQQLMMTAQSQPTAQMPAPAGMA